MYFSSAHVCVHAAVFCIGILPHSMYSITYVLGMSTEIYSKGRKWGHLCSVLLQQYDAVSYWFYYPKILE